MKDAPPSSRAALGVLAALLLGALAGFAAGRLMGRAPSPDAPPGSSAPAPDDSPVVARVGDDVLTKAELDERWRQLDPADRSFHGERARARRSPSGRAHFLDELVDEMLLAREARRRGFQSRTDVRVALEACGNRVLSRPLLAQEVRGNAIPQGEIAAWYDAHPDHFGTPLRVQVSEIVVTSTVTGPGDDTADAGSARAKADALRARAAAGEDFGKLAASSSEAPSARYDGLVGWVVADRIGRPWESKALQMQPGEISEVIEIPEGFAILRADAREETTVPPLDEVREDVIEHLLADDEGALGRRYNIFLRELREKETVDVHPELVGQDDPASDDAAPGTHGSSAGGAGTPGG